ncbi:bifunctional diaminohydroxyphosphoribosylaminopyrimidine deaminase/5-amino-6-(5-phosphoribosylamino)uracil reductase RibD [Mycoplasma sp. P36-A1]|uniref:bifunctional diaminohydroxyphosphoribosylaminopyrimidine deaminase/5-amino-6-(5-phosphoribosylamino)uracil reductase RibD n=1 Tax=Mycoplasma sp. P36-A1 TaxID=3252900 RepID=UPI003C2FB006
MKDIDYMQKALLLAAKGQGYVSPNPMVGAIIVKDDKIIGKGYHMKYKENHAEVNAINSASESLENATMYVTLEPCTHYGNTPPCVDAIIKAKISMVVIATLDVNLNVSGKGVAILKANNIKVTVGVLEAQAQALNKVYNYFTINNLPYLTLKYAMSIDGKIATYTNDSKWISNELSRLDVHKTRSMNSAIMVGINTIINDNPLLNCRIEGGRDPIRIIVDTTLKIPINSLIVQTSSSIKTIIATCSSDIAKIKNLEKYGCIILKVKQLHNLVDLHDLMSKLALMKIDSILLEGGSTLNWSAINQEIVNEIHVYIGSLIIGGKNSLAPVGGRGFEKIKDTLHLSKPKTKIFEDDILLMYEVLK